MKIFTTLRLLLVLFLLPHPAFADPQMADTLAEVNRSFTFHGKPIHPKLFHNVIGWISDPSSGPVIITQDLAAAEQARNEYDADNIRSKEGSFYYSDQNGYYSYKWVGKLKGKIHLVELSEGGDGSGVFNYLLFLKFAEGTGYTSQGVPYPQLLMTVQRVHTLGDKVRTEYEIKRNLVTITSYDNASESVHTDTLSFP